MTVDLDMVEHPQHYLKHPSGLEVIDITRHHNFCVGNALKYIFRHEYKGKPVEDLRKAIQYIEFEIADIEKRQTEVEAEEAVEEQAEPAFHVGDMVRHKTVPSASRGIVLEVGGDRARVRWLSNSFGICRDSLNTLEHLPPTEWFREGDRVRKRNDRGLIGPNAATFQFYKPSHPLSDGLRAWCIWDWDEVGKPLHSDPESLELIPEELPA